jgi:glycosyltransferase involved in cell wall biosynthesis
MKILIVAYQFCPRGEVGTRRWSKFAKYLANKGYEVHVICAKYANKDKVNWCHDVENHPNIKIHRLPSHYPDFALSPNRTFKVKLADRILKHTTNYLDIGQQWRKTLIPYATKLIIREDIRNVFVTAAPFTPMVFMAQVKQKLSTKINLVLDLRDPWDYYLNSGKKWFDNWRKKVAHENEAYAFQIADKVIFISDLFKQEYTEKHPTLSDKFEVVHNGFDKDDFKDVDTAPVSNFEMVYLGSLMTERVEALTLLAQAIHELKDDFIDQNLKVNLYSHNFVRPQFSDSALQATFDRHMILKPTVSVSEVPNVMAQHEYCLTINARAHANAFGVKTFDYMGINKKIFLIGPDGDLPKVLKAANQYVADYDIENIKTVLLRMKADAQSEVAVSENLYTSFELGHLTEKIENCMIRNE